MHLKKIKYRQFTETASLFFALIVAFWIPSYRWLISDFIVAWLTFSIAGLHFKTRFKQNVSGSLIIFSIAFQLILFFFVALEIFFTDKTEVILKNILHKLSLLLFPMLFALSGKNFKEKKILFLKLFVLSNALMSLICLAVASYHAISFNTENFFVYKQTEYGFSYYKESLLSVFHHRSYFAMYIVFSLAILFYLREHNRQGRFLKKELVFWSIILLFVLMIYLLASRAGVLSGGALLLWVLYKKFLSGKIVHKATTLILFILLLFLLFTNKRIVSTVQTFKQSYEETQNLAGSHAPKRILLWKSALDIIPDYFWFGTGAGNFQEIFNQQFAKNTKTELASVNAKNLNVHNQFLEEWLKYGIFALLSLLAIFIVPIIFAVKKKNYLFLAFLSISGFNFLFESMLNTLAGIVFFAFFFNYFIFVFKDKKTHQTKTV